MDPRWVLRPSSQALESSCVEHVCVSTSCVIRRCPSTFWPPRHEASPGACHPSALTDGGSLRAAPAFLCKHRFLNHARAALGLWVTKKTDPSRSGLKHDLALTNPPLSYSCSSVDGSRLCRTCPALPSQHDCSRAWPHTGDVTTHLRSPPRGAWSRVAELWQKEREPSDTYVPPLANDCDHGGSFPSLPAG